MAVLVSLTSLIMRLSIGTVEEWANEPFQIKELINLTLNAVSPFFNVILLLMRLLQFSSKVTKLRKGTE